MSQVFSILTLPRCRSAWLANFLDYPPAVCIHEPVRRRPDLAHLRQVMQASPMPFAGLVDPSMVGLGGKAWMEAFEGTPVGFIVRPPQEVVESLEAAFPGGAAKMIVEATLYGMEVIHDAWGGVPILQAKDVGDPAKLRVFLAKLVPELLFNEGRYEQLSRLRVTVVGYAREELEV